MSAHSKSKIVRDIEPIGLKALLRSLQKRAGHSARTRPPNTICNFPRAERCRGALDYNEHNWDWWETKWLSELSECERMKFEALRTDRKDREAFRIIRNFARLVNDAEGDFRIVAEHLAKRLGVTLQTGCNIRRRFCEAGILEQTAAYVAHKFAARFRWIAGNECSLGA